MAFPVKICGITRDGDALLAERLGAFAVGFIFYPKSPRYIAPAAAGEISRVLGRGIERVGVFVDESPDTVRETVSSARLTAVQLHGGESPEYARELRGVKVIRAFRVGDGFDPGVLRGYPADFFLLDTGVKGSHGGTGKTFDWTLARPCGVHGKVILAGGLTAGNLREAVETAHPWGVDISSGVESAPGVKDAEKMTAVFQVMRSISENV